MGHGPNGPDILPKYIVYDAAHCFLNGSLPARGQKPNPEAPVWVSGSVTLLSHTIMTRAVQGNGVVVYNAISSPWIAQSAFHSISG